MQKKIKKILIANRGEIAIRIAKTCNRLKIKTVGIYSEQDESSLHLDFMDEKCYLSTDPLSGSYLNKDKIIKACKKLKVMQYIQGTVSYQKTIYFLRPWKKTILYLLVHQIMLLKKWVIRYLQKK